MRRAPVILVIAGLMLMAGYRVKVGPRWLNRDAPFVPTPAPSKPAPLGPERRLLLIVLDGARADAVPLVPSLVQLHTAAELTADLPTISAAQYVALLAGVAPLDSGRRSNDTITATGLDSVPAVARRAGARTTVVSDCVDWWWHLFPDAFDDHDPPGPQHQLAVVHLCAFDDAGHRSGAATDDYRVQAAASIERDVSALLRTWSGDVVVTSDHGHRLHGGHGGDEPDVSTTFALFSGPDVRPNVRTRGRAIDLAPTLSALLRLPSPASSQGRTLVDVLERTDDEKRALAAEDLRRIATLDAGPALDAAAHGETVERGVRGLLALAGLVLALRALRVGRIGWAAGAATFVATVLVYLTQWEVSLSGHRDYGALVVDTALVGVCCASVCAVLPAVLVARRHGGAQARAFLLAAALGAGPVAVVMLVAFGITSQRVFVSPAWALALPSLSCAAWAGNLLAMWVGALALSLKRS